MTLRRGRLPPAPRGSPVNFSTTSPTSRRSWPTALAQHEGDHRREADLADHDHCDKQDAHHPPLTLKTAPGYTAEASRRRGPPAHRVPWPLSKIIASLD